MKFIKKKLIFTFFFLIKINIFKLPKKSLRIIIFHDIENFKKFNTQLLALTKDWNFISPNEFYKIISGKKKNNQRSLLITFDDGFKSNLTVAEKYLKKFKLNAYFIPLKFALLKNKKINFFLLNIIWILKN